MAFSAVQDVATNATFEERSHFQDLWEYTATLLDQGIIGYFLPQTMVVKMGYQELINIAKRLSDSIKTDIYISYEDDESAYYVGQIFDQKYLRSLFENTSIHCVQFKKPQPLLLQEDTNQTHSSSPGGLTSGSVAPTMAEKISKPRNMWILYRQDKHNFVLAMNPGMHTSQISSVISEMWRGERPEIREYYKMLAEEEKAKHRLQYPDYKCSPRKPSDIKKRKRGLEESSADGH